TQHSPLRGVQILCLVDHDMGVGGGSPGEEISGACADPQVRGLTAVPQQPFETLDAAPHLPAARRPETCAASPAARAEVGAEVAEVLAEDDVTVLLRQETGGERQVELL